MKDETLLEAADYRWFFNKLKEVTPLLMFTPPTHAQHPTLFRYKPGNSHFSHLSLFFYIFLSVEATFTNVPTR